MTFDKSMIKVAAAPPDVLVEVTANLGYYAFIYDYGRWDELEQVFTDDAVYDIIAHPATDPAKIKEHFGSAHELGLPMRGVEHIRQFLGARFDDNSPFQRRHFITNVVISEYSPARLESLAYMLETKTTRGGSDAPDVTMSCVFVDELVKCPDDRWRIKHRKAYPDRMAQH